MKIDLHYLVDSRPLLLKFLGSISKDIIDAIPSRDKIHYDSDTILLGLDEVLFCLSYRHYDVDIYRGHIEAVIWFLKLLKRDDIKVLIEMTELDVTNCELNLALFKLFYLLEESLKYS